MFAIPLWVRVSPDKRHLTIPPNLCDLYVSVRDKHKYFIYLIKYKSYCITDYVRNEYTLQYQISLIVYSTMDKRCFSADNDSILSILSTIKMFTSECPAE